MLTSPPSDLEQHLPATRTAAGLQHEDNQMKPARVLQAVLFITTDGDQAANVSLSPLLCFSPPVTKATMELLTEQSSHYQRHARSYVRQYATFLY